MNKREHRKMNKLKKQIGELFVLGEISQEESEEFEKMEAKVKISSDFNENEASTSTVKLISRKVAEARHNKTPGPILTLTLERLNGVHMSHEEIRDLVHFSVIGPVVNKPKWVYFRPWKSTSQTILIRVNCTNDYIENNDYSFNFVDKFFSKSWIRMHSEVGKRMDFWNHMIKVPVSLQEQIREKIVKLKNLENEGNSKESLKLMLVMTNSDMVNNDYPWPVNDIVPTKKKYKPLSANSPVFALDCEMCKTKGAASELTRISLIREDGSVVFDTLVKPHNEITDYLTKFSGITAQMMKNVNVRLSDVQKALQVILPPDAILLGHSLEFDLRAMKMAHPYCIDAGLLYCLSGSRKMKTSLKNLVYLFLNKDIQSATGHCSVEDSYAALELYRLKMKHGLIFGCCDYGWNFDEWNIKKDEERRRREEEDAKINPFDELEEKRRRVETKERQKIFCECGLRIDIDCILEDCQCQKMPPSKCILCLGNEDPFPEEEDWLDWGDSILKDIGNKTRPLSYYMIDGNRTVMLGYEATGGLEVEANKIFTIKRPSTFLSLKEYVYGVTEDLLNYKLAMIELDYVKREEEISNPGEGDGASEDGELPAVMPEVVAEMDSNIEKIITSAAKHSLIVLVFSSPTASICYLKVKP